MPTKTQTVRITLNPRAGTPENCMFVGKSLVKGAGGNDIEMAMESLNKMYKHWGNDKKVDAERKYFIRPLKRGDEILIKYTWELTEDGKFSRPEYEEQKAVLDFLRAMPNVEVKGLSNKNKKSNPTFLLEILEETTVAKIGNFAKTLSARNIAHDMPLDKRRDVAYYFGKDVSKLDDDAVLILLVGEAKTANEGFVLMDENIDEFITLAKKMDLENPEVKIRTTLKKAIAASLITIREGSYYKSGGDFIGLNENEAMAYLKDKTGYMESIKKEVATMFNEAVAKSVDDEQKKSVGINPLEGTEKLENIDSPSFNPLNLSKAEMKKYAEMKNLPAAKVTNDPEKIRIKVEEYLKTTGAFVE